MYPFVGFTVFYGSKETAHNQSTLSKTDPTDNQAALNISYIYPSSLKKGRIKKKTCPLNQGRRSDCVDLHSVSVSFVFMEVDDFDSHECLYGLHILGIGAESSLDMFMSIC